MSAPSRSSRRVLAAITALATMGVSLVAATGAASASSPSPKAPTGSVIVFGCADPAGAVKAAGGKVTAELSLIKGVAASLPSGASIASCTVAVNRALHVSSINSQTAKDIVTSDSAPISTARQTLGLTSQSPDGAADGEAVTVAVVDTGIYDSADLDGRVIHHDVTDTSRHSAPDGYGHGTFVGGLIAGDGAASGGAYVGAAPQARLFDVRVADATGATSLVDVLRGLEAVAHAQRHLNIKVLNLSLSSGSPVPYQFDPLTLALEGLWKRGITVVVPAGNDGPGAGTISSPGNDPTLLTVGSLDEGGTAARSDDTIAGFSSRGPAAQGVAKPDLVSPGSHLVSLRAPGSVVDTENPNSRVANSYFRGSGTSMSTALTSGVVADLLSVRPNLSPDQVKAILTSTAYDAKGLADVAGAGAGGVDANAAFTASTPTITEANDNFPSGQDAIWDKFSNALLSGDRADASFWWQKLSPSARSWVARSWTSLSPDARSWVARSWVARSWTGADGTADEWLARSWVARSWVARSWVARSWVNGVWSGRSWVARSWVARSWVDAGDWTARSWTDDEFTARSWTARSWTARSWTTADWS
jgi:serine protease AprX